MYFLFFFSSGSSFVVTNLFSRWKYLFCFQEERLCCKYSYYVHFFIKNTFSTHRFLAVMQLADKGRIWINLELFLFLTGLADDCNILLQVFLAVWPVLWRLGSFWTLHVYEVHSSSFSQKIIWTVVHWKFFHVVVSKYVKNLHLCKTPTFSDS